MDEADSDRLTLIEDRLDRIESALAHTQERLDALVRNLWGLADQLPPRTKTVLHRDLATRGRRAKETEDS